MATGHDSIGSFLSFEFNLCCTFRILIGYRTQDIYSTMGFSWDTKVNRSFSQDCFATAAAICILEITSE